MNIVKLIESVINNENYNRYDIFRNRKEIIKTMQADPDQYEDIYDTIIDIIEEVNETL